MTRVGLSVTLLLAGATASMPLVMVGHILAERFGTVFAVVSILVGNAALCGIGFLTVHLALKYKATTSDTVGALGGETLSKVFGLAMVISMLGWFAVQCSVLVEFAQGYFPAAPHIVLTALVGVSLTLAAMGDIKRLFWLSEKLGPFLLLACLAMFVWLLFDTRVVAGEQRTFEFWPALSLVIAASLGVVIDVPTYYRVLTSRKEAFASIFVVAFPVTCLVQALGVLFVSKYDGTQLIMSPFGVVLAASGWLMNVNNLYSAVVSSQTIIKRGSFAVRTVALATVALVIVSLHAGESLANSIEAITLGISSMGGVMAACAIVQSRNAFVLALSWFIGLLSGTLSLTAFVTLTGAAQIDAFLCAGLFATLSLLGVQLWQSQLSTKQS